MKIVLICFFCFFHLSSMASDLPDTIDRIRGGIVGIGIYRPEKSVNPKGPNYEYRGTGFAVKDGRFIVTNNHVVPEKIEDEPGALLAIFAGRGEAAKARPATVVKKDEEHDLVLLKINGSPLPALSINESSTVREGQEIAFTGFPIGIVLGMYPVTSRGIISAITPIVIPAISSRTLTAEQIHRARSNFYVYQLDAIAYPGNSGSPLYNPSNGEVLGVINSVFVKTTKEAILQNPSAIAYAIPVKYVSALLHE